MKKIIAGLMIAAAMFTFGCSGRNADFGTVDMSEIEGRCREGWYPLRNSGQTEKLLQHS